MTASASHLVVELWIGASGVLVAAPGLGQIDNIGYNMAPVNMNGAIYLERVAKIPDL